MSAVGIGTSLARVDGRAKVTGTARYAADFNRPHQAHAVIVGATVGLGRVVSIDTAPVERMPGVLAVLSHRNAPKLAYRAHRAPIDPPVGERLHVLQDGQVRFYGQPVALIVAETLDQAERAAAALQIRYEATQPVIDARDKRAQRVEPTGGGGHADAARGDAEAAFAAAPVKVSGEYDMARENHTPMELHATVAAWEGDRVTLWSKSQFVVNEQAEIAAVFGLPRENVQVVCPFIGGAFGTSLRTWPHVTLAALAARVVGRPVKLVLTRRQTFFHTGHRPRTLQRVALGATREGKLTAVIHEGAGETSRYEQYVEALTSATAYMYSSPNVLTRYRLVPLDTGTPLYMRGPGESSGIFALESALDELSYTLGIDPIELRRRNEPKVDESDGRPFSSRSLVQAYALGAEKFGWAKRNPAPRSMRDGRLLIGWGVASSTYPALQNQASARARRLLDGAVEIETAASDMGPGTYTSLTQVAAETLGMPVDRITLRIGSSAFPPTPPHGGSQTMASVGTAVRAACVNLRAEIAKGGNGMIEATGSSVRDPEAAKRYSMHAFGAVFAEVAVDPDLGMVRVRRMVGAYGAGRIVNPRLARSQCIGGMVGGIGMALMERTVLDARDGRPVNAHMGDYLVPVNLDIAELEAHFVPEEDPHVNGLGVKGLGEISLVGVAPAIANAIFHATGKRIRTLPIRLEDLLHA